MDANTPRAYSWWNCPRALDTLNKYDIYMFAWDYRNSTPYSQAALKGTITHECGHTLGLGDAYGANAASNTVEVPTKGWLLGDKMRENGPVTSNDIEMMLEAFKMNEKQAFAGTDKSSVIRLP